MMKKLLFPTALFSSVALAGPPYQTDDPEPVDVGEKEMYFAIEQTRTRDGISASQPLIELNYGAAPNVQIGVGVPYALNNPTQGATERGVGDIELSVKYRVLQESDNRPMLSIFPMVALPTGDADKGLGNGKAQYFLPIWMQKNWGDWQCNSGGGYWINSATDARNHWFFGVQLQRKIAEQWTLGGELFHSTEEVRGEGASSGFNLGGTYALDEHNHLLFSAGRGISNVQATNSSSYYFGYQLTW